MTSESATNTSRSVLSGQTVSVPRPDSGEQIAVASSPAGLLDFAFDPSSATASREGNSLIFDLDDGGRVTITDFFVVGDESLPGLRLPDGVEVASADFFSGSELDMSTAAGASAPPSGGSSAEVDPLSMTDGIDKLGDQGTWFWGRTLETDEEAVGTDQPIGSFGFSLTTDLGFAVVDSLYEDARPFQHQGDQQMLAGRVNMQVETGPGTNVGVITFAGLPEGAVLWLGDPADGGTALTPNAAGQYLLNYEDFTGQGIYLTPPANSDADFDINVSVQFVRGGASVIVDGLLPVTVDAVADRPEDIAGRVDADELSGAATIGGAQQTQKDGWISDEASREEGQVGSEQVSYTARMTVTATFGDYGENDAADQGELHYALVQKPGEGWTCDEAVDTVKIYHDAQGNALAPVWNEATQSFDYELRPQGAVGDPVEFFRVPVDNDTILQNGGTVDVDVTLRSPDGYFDATGGDHAIDLITGGMAWESAPADNELSMQNNVAVNFGEGKATLDIDVIDSSLTLKLGWFAEGGDAAGEKHTGKTGADYTPSVYGDATNAGASAKIELSIDNSAAEARSEHISQVTFTFDPDAGSLSIGGQPLAPGSYDIGGTVYQVSVEGDTVTINISGNPVSGLDALDLAFVPGPAFDADDVPFSYTVTVDSAETGAQAVFSGDSHVVADAVADMPSDLTIGREYLEDHTAVAPGGTATVEGSATFSDNDGSERHYVVVTMQDKSWSIDGVGNNSNLLSKNAINEYWNSLTGDNLPQDVLLSILTPGGEQGASANRQYLLFEAYMDEAGEWQVTAYGADKNGDLVDVTQVLKDAGAVFGFDPATGELSYSIQVTAPQSSTDTSATFYTKGVTLETEADDEYDYRNNIAGSDNAKSATVQVEALTGKLSMELTMAEDGQPNQYLENAQGEKDTSYSGNAVLIDGEYYGDGIDMAFTGGSAKEYVQSVSFDPLPEGGTLYFLVRDADGNVIEARPIGAGDVISNTLDKNGNPDPNFLDNFSFKPNEDYSGDGSLNFTAVIGSTRTPSYTVDQQGTGDLHVDSVADLASAHSSMAGDDRGQGLDQAYAPDGPAQVDERGWSTQTSGGERSVSVNFTITVTFDDIDGSESGHILIALPQGFSIPVDSNGNPLYQSHSEGGVTYLRIDVGQLNGENGLLTVNSGADNATYSTSVRLDVDNTVENRTTNLDIKVVTTEAEAEGDLLTNNVAVKVIEQPVTVDHFESSLTVKAGWGYEGNDADKFGGQAQGAHNADYNDARDDGNGVPVQIAFAGQDGESLSTITLTFSGGTMYAGNFSVESPAVFDASAFKNGTLNLRFVPDEGVSDDDIDIGYTAVVKDASGATFTVTGGVTVAIDAVADIGAVSSVGMEADNATVVGGAYEDDMSVTVTVQATFTDTDGSERHYILVERPEGWNCEGADIITLYYDASGNPLQPVALFDGDGNFQSYDYATAPEGAVSSKEFFRADVTDQDSGSLESYTVTLTPGENAVMTDQTLDTGSMSVESDFNRNEYDFSNNHAFDIKEDAGNLNLMDSRLTVDNTNAYEDHMADQHLGSTALSGGGVIHLEIGKGEGAAFEQGGGNDFLDADGNVVITFTFNPTSEDAEPGSFTFTAGGVTYTYSLEATPGAFVQTGENQYTVTIPASQVAGGSGNVSSADIRYNPGLNDDSDLTNIQVTVPVKSADTGFTTTMQTEAFDLVVDAVADKPLEGGGAVTGFDQTQLGGQDAYSAADWGSAIAVQVSASFSDFTDGSEKHYLVIEAREGWSCDNADGVVEVNGVLYFYKEASPDADGQDSHEFLLTAPTAQTAGAGDAATITADGSVKLQSGGLALEGDGIESSGSGRITITDATRGDTVDYGDLVAGENEITLENNIAVTTTDTTIKFDVINSASGTARNVYEDGNANKHYDGTDAYYKGTAISAKAIATNNGAIRLELGDKTGGDVISTGAEAETPNSITFTYGGAEGSLGSFTYTGADGASHTIWAQNVEGTNQYVLNIPDGAVAADGKSVSLTYNPADATVDYASDDLTNMQFHLNVESTTSKAAGSVSGTLGTGKLIVDAVADRPELEGLDKDYAGEQSAAQAGQAVDVKIEGAQFFDYVDGSESHYLVIETGQVTYENEAGGQGTETFGRLGPQTITITGTDANGNAVTQTIVIGTNYKNSSITITDAEGNTTPYSVSSGTYNYMTGASTLTLGSDSYVRIPVMNDFLQMTADGTVSATVSVTMPSGQESDTTYTLKAGAYAVESEAAADRLTTTNDKAAELQEIAVEVKVVTSDFNIDLVSSRVYENGRPEWFRTSGEAEARGYDNDAVGGYKYTYENGKAVDAEFKPLFDGNGQVIAENLEYAGARLDLTGIDQGETATITFTFTMGSDAGGQAALTQDNWGAFYDADGNKLDVDFTLNDDGSLTLVIVVPGLENGADQPIYFVPGQNYSADDISIDWQATVVDDASGAATDFARPESDNMTITVDAVAQNTDSTLEVGGLAANEDGSFYVGSKAGFTVEITADFEDVDGSETHYMLVEMTESTALDPAFMAALKELGCDLALGENRYYDFSGAQSADTPGGVFYKIPVSVLEELAENPAFSDCFSRNEETGEITVSIPMSMDENSAAIRTGTMSVDADSSQFGDYYDDSGRVNENINLSKANDVAVNINEAAVITVSQATVSVSLPERVAYEGDNKDAHQGDTQTEGGVALSPGISLGAHDSFVAVNPATGGYEATSNQVQVSWNPTTAGQMLLDGQPVQSGAWLTADQAGALVFVPDATSTSDADVTVTYTLADVQDARSGQVISGGSYTQKVVVDAVAQQPQNVAGPEETLEATYNSELPFEFTVTFTDVDGSTDHYGLVEYKAGWQLQIGVDDNGAPVYAEVVVAPDGNQYFQIPVSVPENLQQGATGFEATVSGTLVAPGYLLGDQNVTLSEGSQATLGGNMGHFDIGGLSVDNAGGGSEATWHNNAAWNIQDDGLKVDYDFEGGGGGNSFWVLAYENDMPLANEGIYETLGGTQFSFPGVSNGDTVTLTLDPARGVITGPEGSVSGPDENGNYTIAANKGDVFTFTPADNYKDTDLNVAVSVNGQNHGTMHVIVDAVAQLPEIGGYTLGTATNPATGDEYPAYAPGQAMEITVNASFPDTDGSEQHYILVAVENGWEGNYDIFYYKGTAYYQIPAEADGSTTINLTPPSGGAMVGGVVTHELDYLVMSVEKPTDQEVVSSNNVAIAEPETPIVVQISEVSTTVTANLEETRVLESDGTQTINGSITISLGEHDQVTGVKVTANGEGDLVLTYKGQELVLTADGVIDPGASENQAFYQDLINDSEGRETVSVDVAYTPAAYDSTDIDIKVNVSAQDMLSGQAKSSGGVVGLDVDGIGWRPTDVESQVEAYEGAAAAKVGDSVGVSISASFENVGGAEQHYLLIESKANWDYPDGLEKTYDAARTEFLMMPVDEYVKAFLADPSVNTFTTENGITFTVAYDDHGHIRVTAEFDVTLPEFQVRGDETYVLKTGGLSVNTPADDYNTVANDVAFNTEGRLEIEVGVVDTKVVSGTPESAHITEGQGEGSASAPIAFVTDNASDTVSGVEITVPEGLHGVLLYNGVQVTPDENGVLVLPPEGDAGAFNPSGLTFVPDAYWSGEVSLDFTATVTDIKSGAVSADNAYSGNISIVVDPEATSPVSVQVTGPQPGEGLSAFEADTQVSFEVTAVFPDWDGSEDHYVLIEVQDGWSGSYDTFTDPESGAVYFKVPVPEDADYTETENGGSVTVTVTLTTPDAAADTSYSLKVGALAEEDGERAFHVDADQTLNLTVGVVESTGDNLGASASGMDEDAEGAGASQLLFSLDGGEANHEELVSITVTLPESGGRIYDASTGEYLEAQNDGSYLLNGALAQSGSYYYEAADNVSGDLELGYSALVRDVNSGATSEITGQSVNVSVNAVTDAPVSSSAEASGPQDVAGHEAVMNVTLSADFVDATGSEVHYFLVVLPAGAYPDPANNWGEALSADNPLLASSAFAGESNVYLVPASQVAGASQGAAEFAVRVQAGYDEASGGIQYQAGSFEAELYDPAGGLPAAEGAVKYAPSGEVAIDAGSLTFNLAPAVQDSAAAMDDFLRTPADGAHGTLNMGESVVGEDGVTRVVDVDGDSLKVSGARLLNAEGQPVEGPEAHLEGDLLSINGEWGVLTINIYTGAYSYNLYSETGDDGGVVYRTPAANEVVSESFSVDVSEYLHSATGAALDNLTQTGVITITLNGENSAPEAASRMEAAGGVNETELAPVSGSFVFTDADGDAAQVIVTEVGGVPLDPESGLIELMGQYGKLVMDVRGNYTYTLYDETASGQESFNVSFVDPYGAGNSSTLTVDVAPVNHGPVAQDTVRTGYNPDAAGSASFVRGELDLAAMDVDAGDVPVIASVTVNGVIHEMPASGTLEVQGEHGLLKIMSTGEYQYERTDAEAHDVWDSFEYTLKDSGGLTDSAALHVGIGSPDPADITLETTVTDALGHDGDFNLGALGGEGYAIHAYDGNDTINGSDGNDSIHAGSGDDVIHARGLEGSETTVYGEGGDDLIFAGQGSDQLHGGSGDDTFVWNADNGFGGNDLVADFSHSAFGGADNDQLQISFSDLFGDATLTSSQVISGMTGEGNTYTFTHNDASFSATFGEDNSILLSMQNNSGTSQTITVQSAEAFYTPDAGTSMDADVAQAILEQIIKDVSS